MDICIHACITRVHIWTNTGNLEKIPIQNVQQGPPSDDKVKTTRETCCWEGTILLACSDFFLSHIQAVLAPLPPSCPSFAAVAVVPFLSHSDYLWGIHMCLQKPSNTLKLRGANWAVKGPCGLGQVTVVHLPVWKWSVRPRILTVLSALTPQ